ncbi:polysaccharide export protein [Salinisphaera hydrothermalis C41B8]|uniref:Polysaccharide export protein n=2 Tax=Salinisphaera TaxID=180541 RepID=A0A084IQ12_SALHC|nr:polysaccharide export protein [Salinisphaera hydrothermalis C41B8]
MVGEFSKQMALPYSTGGMSLNDAIADAGGVSLDSANTSAIYVIRGLTDETSVNSESGQTISRPTVYRLNANSPVGLVLANQFELKPRDIVYAAPASLVNFNRAFAQITPALNTIFQTLLIYSRANNGGL